MKKKVSLRELVAMKIIFVLILAMYYWMWARTDWKPEYQNILDIPNFFVFGILCLHLYRVGKYKKESVDELAEQNLRRCDSVCLKILSISALIIAYIGGILGHIQAIDTAGLGWLLIAVLFVLSILRTALFIVMDSKGV